MLRVDVAPEVTGHDLTWRNGGKIEQPHGSTSIGAVHRNVPHVMISVPLLAPPGSLAMVNCSTGGSALPDFMAAVPRSRALLYSVPHCPVCRFTIGSTPPVRGIVNRVYVPAGSDNPASLTGCETVSWVAALAPVRQTRSYGITLPSSERPRARGRPYSTVKVAPPTVARTVSRTLSCCCPVLRSAAAIRSATGSTSGGVAGRATAIL